MTESAQARADVDVIESAKLDAQQRVQLHELFDQGYDQANHDYLDLSIGKLARIAVARHGDRLAGFALGDCVKTSLARLERPQMVGLAGISCIDPEFRRQGLFSELGAASIAAGDGFQAGETLLFAGRMAHPITYRTMASRLEGSVPRGGAALSDWHREVGLQVAALFGVTIDAETLVVIGAGRPIGFPRLEYEPTDEEEALFRGVDRNRGDSLLAMAWIPEPPPDW